MKENDRKQKKRLAIDIAYAKTHSDYTVMCLHCGGQFNDEPTKYAQEVTEFCIQKGINAVIGNHEHLIQKSKLRDLEHLITYCLGNFTSNYGIDRKPFDKNAECSILLNIYIDEISKRASEVGFSILISVKTDKEQIVTKPLFDYMKTIDGDLYQELEKKNTRAVNAFLGTTFSIVKPQKEYFVSQLLDEGR